MLNNIILLRDLSNRVCTVRQSIWQVINPGVLQVTQPLTFSLVWSCLTWASRASSAGVSGAHTALPWQEDSAFTCAGGRDGSGALGGGNVTCLHCSSSICRTFFCCSTPARSEVSFWSLSNRPEQGLEGNPTGENKKFHPLWIVPQNWQFCERICEGNSQTLNSFPEKVIKCKLKTLCYMNVGFVTACPSCCYTVISQPLICLSV